MRIAVIGGSGVIGSPVVRTLEKQHQIFGCARSTCDFVVDITSPDAITRLFDATGPVDAVVCVAGDVVFKPFERWRTRTTPSASPTS